jgi:hypothetical protein
MIVHTMRAFALDFMIERVFTIIMITNAPIKPFPALPSCANWIARGLLVGMVHGAAAGTMLPIVGTVVGAVTGTCAGLVLGIAMAGLAAFTRHQSPVESEELQNRERALVVVLIVAPFLVFAMFGDSPLWLLPALPGVIHSCIAGIPTPEHPFCGEVNDTRRKLLVRFPAAVAVLMLAGFTIFAVAQ